MTQEGKREFRRGKIQSSTGPNPRPIPEASGGLKWLRYGPITEAALNLAKDWGLCPLWIEGTGKDGRVLKGDVENAIAELRERVESELKGPMT